MPNSHRRPDKTRQSCLCRVRRCELSLETVWQSLNSQPIDHPRRVAFSEQVLRFSHTQQSTACLQFAWRTTSLRVGGREARRSCLPGLRRGGGGRQAGATVLSCELTTGQVRSTSECDRRSHCAARHTPTQTRRRTHLSGDRTDSVHTATPDTTKQSCLCRVWRGRANWTIATNVLRVQIFCRRQS